MCASHLSYNNRITGKIACGSKVYYIALLAGSTFAGSLTRYNRIDYWLKPEDKKGSMTYGIRDNRLSPEQ